MSSAGETVAGKQGTNRDARDNNKPGEMKERYRRGRLKRLPVSAKRSNSVGCLGGREMDGSRGPLKASSIPSTCQDKQAAWPAGDALARAASADPLAESEATPTTTAPPTAKVQQRRQCISQEELHSRKDGAIIGGSDVGPRPGALATSWPREGASIASGFYTSYYNSLFGDRPMKMKDILLQAAPEGNAAATRTVRRHCSLNVLPGGHVCFQDGGALQCKCRIPLYRPGSSASIAGSAKPTPAPASSSSSSSPAATTSATPTTRKALRPAQQGGADRIQINRATLARRPTELFPGAAAGFPTAAGETLGNAATVIPTDAILASSEAAQTPRRRRSPRMGTLVRVADSGTRQTPSRSRSPLITGSGYRTRFTDSLLTDREKSLARTHSASRTRRDTAFIHSPIPALAPSWQTTLPAQRPSRKEVIPILYKPPDWQEVTPSSMITAAKHRAQVVISPRSPVKRDIFKSENVSDIYPELGPNVPLFGSCPRRTVKEVPRISPTPRHSDVIHRNGTAGTPNTSTISKQPQPDISPPHSPLSEPCINNSHGRAVSARNATGTRRGEATTSGVVSERTDSNRGAIRPLRATTISAAVTPVNAAPSNIKSALHVTEICDVDDLPVTRDIHVEGNRLPLLTSLNSNFAGRAKVTLNDSFVVEPVSKVTGRSSVCRLATHTANNRPDRDAPPKHVTSPEVQSTKTRGQTEYGNAQGDTQFSSAGGRTVMLLSLSEWRALAASGEVPKELHHSKIIQADFAKVETDLNRYLDCNERLDRWEDHLRGWLATLTLMTSVAFLFFFCLLAAGLKVKVASSLASAVAISLVMVRQTVLNRLSTMIKRHLRQRLAAINGCLMTYQLMLSVLDKKLGAAKLQLILFVDFNIEACQAALEASITADTRPWSRGLHILDKKPTISQPLDPKRAARLLLASHGDQYIRFLYHVALGRPGPGSHLTHQPCLCHYVIGVAREQVPDDEEQPRQTGVPDEKNTRDLPSARLGTRARTSCKPTAL